MDYDAHRRAIERELLALHAALGAGPLDVSIPSCPEWTLEDLALHIGEFSGWWTHILCAGTGRPAEPSPAAPSGDVRGQWCADRSAALEVELAATPPDTTVWTWVKEDKSARFVARRCANELAIHRYDAELARGRPQPIEAELARDGIDEIFVMMANRDVTYGGAGETLHLHATDCDAEWLLTIGPDGIDVRHEHAKGDAAVRGAVSDLELLLYRRPPIGPLEQFGDPRPLELFHAAFDF